jgi:hypothetical protein
MGQFRGAGAGAMVRGSVGQDLLAVLLIALAALLLLCGCAARPAAIPLPKVVKEPVPFAVYCAPARPAPPALAIAGLRADSPPADTVRAYAADVAALKAAVTQRDELLDSCRAPAKSN